MAGMFDDLIPKKGRPTAGLFDDLIPRNQRVARRTGGELPEIPDREPEQENAPTYTGNAVLQSDAGTGRPLNDAINENVRGFSAVEKPDVQPKGTGYGQPTVGEFLDRGPESAGDLGTPPSPGQFVFGFGNTLGGVGARALAGGAKEVARTARGEGALTDFADQIDDPNIPSPPDPEDSALYGLSQSIDRFGEDMAARGASFEEAAARNRPDDPIAGYMFDVMAGFSQMAPALVTSKGASAAGMAPKVAANLGLLEMGTQVALGEYSRRIHDEGMDPLSASQHAILQAAYETVPEKMFGVFERFISASDMGRIKRIFAQAGAEGASEATTEAMNVIDDAIRSGETGSLTEVIGRIGYAAGIGAGMGSVIGTMSGGPQQRNTPSPEPEVTGFGSFGVDYKGKPLQTPAVPGDTFEIDLTKPRGAFGTPEDLPDAPIEQGDAQAAAGQPQQPQQVPEGQSAAQGDARPVSLPQPPIEPIGFQAVDSQAEAPQAPERPPELIDSITDDQLPTIKNEKGEKVPFPDARLKRRDYRAGLKSLTGELRKGGDISLVPAPGAVPKDNTGDLMWDYGPDQVIRTSSVNPQWFQVLADETGLTVKEVKNAAQKALEGKPLGSRQQEAVDAMLFKVWTERTEHLTQFEDLSQAIDEARKLRADARRAAQGELTDAEVEQIAANVPDVDRQNDLEAGIRYAEEVYEQEMNAQERAMYELAEDARAEDEAAVIEALQREQDDAALAAELWDIAHGRKRLTQEDLDRQAGLDPQEPGPQPGQDLEAQGSEGDSGDPGGPRGFAQMEQGQLDRPVEQLVEIDPGQWSTSEAIAVAQHYKRQANTDELTGVGRRGAYFEAEKRDPKPVQVALDVDGLGWINDNIGHESGDQFIEMVGQALVDSGVDTYRLGGDEFVARGDQGAESQMRAVQKILEGTRLTLESPDGQRFIVDGIRMSMGAGATLEEADARLNEEKQRRAEAGERAARKGDRPPNVTPEGLGQDPEGKQDREDGAAGRPGVLPEQTDLTGGSDPTAQAQFDAEQEREQKTNQSPDMLQGEGELFAGPRPPQGDMFGPKAVEGDQKQPESKPDQETDPLEAAQAEADERKRKRDKSRQQLIDDNGGNVEGVTAKKETLDQWATILPEMSDSGGTHRVQRFDKRGFVGHSTYQSADEAMDALVDEGFVEKDSDALNRLSQTDEWREGTAETEAVQAAMQGQKPGQSEIDQAASQADPEPTQPQIEAGNYRKGHINLHGLGISVENERGSVRRGTDADGKKWESELAHHYGYIKRTDGADGEHVDVFLGPDAEYRGLPVFVIDQVNADGTFDEHKVMIGFRDQKSAVKGYTDNYPDGHKVGPVTRTTIDGLKQWLASDDTSQPFADDFDGTRADESASQRPKQSKPTGEYKIADRLSDEHRNLLASIRGTDTANLIGEIDQLWRNLEAMLRKKGTTRDNFDDAGIPKYGSQEGRQEGDWMATAELLVGDLLDLHRRTDGNIEWPVPDSETGEIAPPENVDRQDSPGMSPYYLVEHIDEYMSMGFPVDTFDVTGPLGSYKFGSGAQRPAVEVFPEPEKTRNLDTDLGSETISLEEAQALLQSWKDAATAAGEQQDNSNKVIISLFDYTGAWSRPWEEAGYTVLRYDIKTGSDILIDDWFWNRIEEFTDTEGVEIYGVLSACPCTTFAGSGARWWNERHDKRDKTMLVKTFGEQALASGAESALEYNQMLVEASAEVVRFTKPTKFHALENPIGRIEKMNELPAPSLRFQPNNFGDPYTKRTQIFGAIETDLPTANVDPSEGSKMQSKLRGDRPADKEERSRTPEGFAYAFFIAHDPAARQSLEKPASKPAPKPKAKRSSEKQQQDKKQNRPEPSENTVFTEDAAEKARQLLKKKIGRLNAGIDPEVMQAGLTLAGYHIERGARTFAAYSRAMVNDLGDMVKPYLKSWYLGVKYDPRLDGVEGMDDAGTVESADIDAILQEESDESDQRGERDLEPDRGDTGTPDEVGAEGVSPGQRPDDRTRGQGVRGTRGETRPRGSGGSTGRKAVTPGERGDQSLYTGAIRIKGRAAGGRFDLGSRDAGLAGPAPDHIPAGRVEKTSRKRGSPAETLKAQREANKQGARGNSLGDIRAELPALMEGQQEDVHKAEKRYSRPDGYGMLFTNGTGTGKTFTGLGVIRRFANRGKDNILVVAPSDKIINDWIKSGKVLGLSINKLKDTKDAGRGITITTYANFGANNDIANRDWDLVVHDEAHHNVQGKEGEETSRLSALRAVTLHPRGTWRRTHMLNPDLFDRQAELKSKIDANLAILRQPDLMDQQRSQLQRENEKLEDEFRKVSDRIQDERKKVEADVEARQGEKRPRALFLSATPFAYEKTVDWAEGYLFDYAESGGKTEDFTSYNEGDAREKFMMQHFGYRMRYNKLTEPGPEVDRGLMQRQFNTWLKKKGSVSGRMLDIDADYDRQFVLVESKIGQRIDEALQWFDDYARDASNPQAAREVQKDLTDQFDHLSRRYLLEAIKAKESIPLIREHMEMGRKIVVFHDFKKGGGFNPFRLNHRDGNRDYNAMVDAFNAEFPDLVKSDLGQMPSPLEAFRRAFGDELLVFNGDVPKTKRRENVEAFNSDDTGPRVMLVQSAAGREGISLHDTTGKHPRVLFNLGLPTQPTVSIQTEGRIYRVGQVSNAMFRYLNTGTNWEKFAFATRIAERASAAENLSMGEQARALKDAFITGFEDSGDYRAGMEGEGTGGKEADRAANEALTEFDRAKSYYYAIQKKNSRTKSAEGQDYFATPEPLGLKMVEWADIRPGEDVLEPSAGHGAIARWFPENTNRMAIEPSRDLTARMAMVFDGRIQTRTFEDLHITNKFDAIAMNPPFGHGGKTAIEHLEKAYRHLRDGGRMVAIIPRGPSADKRFDNWLYERNDKDKLVRPDLNILASIDLPSDTFGRAGTNVAARVVVLDKGEVEQQLNRDLTNAKDVNELFDRIEDMDLPARVKKAEPEPEASRPETAASRPETAAADAELFATAETRHAQKGIDLFVAKMNRRVDRETFLELRNLAKRHGGYYSRYNKMGAVPGFQFESAEDRQSFLDAAEGAGVRDESAAYSVHERNTGTLPTGRRESDFGRLRKVSESRAGDSPVQGDLFLTPQAQKGGASRTKVAHSVRAVRVGELKSGIDRVTGPAEAAHVVAPLRKQASEVFGFLVTDGEGRPLAFLRQNIGTANASQVSRPAWGDIYNVPGASRVWMIHNHPSGVEQQSGADMKIAGVLGETLEGTGVDFMGSVVVTPGGRYSYFRDGMGDDGKIAPARRNRGVEVQERQYRGPHRPSDAAPLTSPDLTKNYVRNTHAGQDGVLLLNNRNYPVGFVELSEAEFGRLRTGDKETGFARLASDAAGVNASAAIVVRSRESSLAEMRNINGALNSLELRPLDSLHDIGSGRLESNAERELWPATALNTFFSRNAPAEAGVSGSGVSVGQAKQWAGKLMKGWKNRPPVRVVASETDLPASIQYQIDAQGAHGEISAVIHRNDKGKHEVYVVAENVSSREALERAIFHEVKGHFGLREMLGRDFTKTLDQVYNSYGRTGLNDTIRRYFPDGSFDPNNQIHRWMVAEEHLAVMAERGEKVGLLKRAIAAIKRALRRLGFNRLAAMSDVDLKALLTRAAEFVENGSPAAVRSGATAANFSQSAPIYYSAVLEAASSISQNKAQPQQWLAMIRKKPGVKREEIEWLGLEQWLNDQSKSVTKEDLLEFLRENQVQIEEVTLEGERPEYSEDVEVAQEQFDFLFDELAADPNNEELRQRWEDARIELTEAREAYTRREDEADRYRTQHDEWQEPGGENYKELLLTLPVNVPEAPAIDTSGWTVQVMGDSMERYTGQRDIQVLDAEGFVKSRRSGFRGSDQEAIEAAAETHRQSRQRSLEGGRVFKQNHFEQLNVVAHARLNERADADGKRVLFIEEVQSDWHQAGRKQGYRDLSKENRSLEDLSREELIELLQANDPNGAWSDADAEAEGMPPLTKQEALDKIDDLQATTDFDAGRYLRDQANTDGVPDAPFKQSWPMLVMKRMIRYAADNGFDRIAWTPGDIQADRYDLSQRVDSLYWEKAESDGAVYLSATKNNQVVDEIDSLRIQNDKLDEYVGKDLAEQIRAEPEGGEISGEGLRLGGEGMRAFYDRILKNEVNKYVKKMGARVGTTSVHTGGRRDNVHGEIYTKPFAVLHPDDGSLVEEFDTRADAEASIENWPDARVIETGVNEDSTMESWSVDVTDKMREAALAGQPMFQRVYHGTPHTFDRFSLDAIGTGEGAQAYGWGLYFAGKREIAEFYRDNIPRTVDPELDSTIADSIDDMLIENDGVMPGVDEIMKAVGDVEGFSSAEVQNAVRNFVGDPALGYTDGSLYEAEIPEDSELMDWDAPISQQPEQVQKALKSLPDPKLRETIFGDGPYGNERTGGEAYLALVEYFRAGKRDNVFEGGTGTLGQKAASQELNDLGIPGLRYHDATSRDGSRDSYNYVIWDDSRVTVEAVNDELAQAEQQEFEQLGLPMFQRKPRSGNRDNLGFDMSFNLDPNTGEFQDLKEAMNRAGLGKREGGIKAWANRMQEMTWNRAKDTIKDQRRGFTQGVLDRFYGIKLAEQKYLGGSLPHEQSPYVAARLSTGISSTTRGLLHHGAPEWRDGVISRIEDSKGLLEILDPVKGDLDAFLGWMVGRRARRLKAEGRENLFDEQHISALIQNGEKSPVFDRFEDVAAELDDFKKRVLDVAQQSGLINPKSREAWDTADYIPFYRISMESDMAKGPGGKQSLSHQTSGIRTLKGGKQSLNDPLENLIMNFSHLMDAAMKNHAIELAERQLRGADVFENVSSQFEPAIIPLSQVKRRLKDQGVDTDMIPKSALEGMAKMWAMKAPSDPDVVRIMRKGKAHYFRVRDPLLLRALTAVRDPGLDWMFIKIGRSFKRVMTRGITADPAFMARNFMRDMLHAWTINEDHYHLGIDSIRGAVKSIREKGGAVDMAFSGASFMGGYVNANDPTEAARAIRMALRQKGYDAAARNKFMSSIVDSPLKLWETYTRFGDAVENASREAVYEAARKQGKSRAQAVFEAKDLMDYSMRGDWAAYQMLTDLVPFLNARVQGMYKMGRAGALSPAKVAAKGGMIALAALALLARNKDDERYKDLEEWDKDTYFHVFYGDTHLRIPKPFEVGLLFGTVPERIALNMLEHDDDDKTFERFLWNIRETLALNPTPQMVMPIIESVANRSFFTGAPIESMSDENVEPEDRYSEYTSATMRALGRVTGEIGLSPKKLEHIWHGYTGTMGMYVLSVADMASRTLQGQPPRPEMRIDDYPVIKSFFRAEPARSTKWLTELYDMRAEVNQIYGSLRKYEKEGSAERYQDKLEQPAESADVTKGEILDARKFLNEAGRYNSRIRREMDAVYRDRDMTPEQKREKIDELMAARNDNTKKVMQDIVEFFRTKAESGEDQSP